MSQDELTRRAFLNRFMTAGALVLSYGWGCPNILANTGLCSQLEGKKIRWIVPYSPGGGYDAYSRLIAPFFGARLGAKISIENMPGGGGILGAHKIANANPNGLTMGIVNGDGLLIASLTGDTKAPNPAKDFAIIGRIVRSRLVWATGRNSPLKTMQDVLEESQKRSILFGISEVGSTNFVSIAVASHLLGIRSEYVAGFPGSREYCLAAMRGDIDIVSMTFESGLDRINAGDIRPLLQISAEPISVHPSLDGVALLGGDKGLAVSRAAEIGHDVAESIVVSNAMIGLADAGRLVVAPLGIEKKLLGCLESELYETLTDPAFVKTADKAKRSLDVARGTIAKAGVLASQERSDKIVPIVKNAIKKVRQ